MQSLAVDSSDNMYIIGSTDRGGIDSNSSAYSTFNSMERKNTKKEKTYLLGKTNDSKDRMALRKEQANSKKAYPEGGREHSDAFSSDKGVYTPGQRPKIIGRPHYQGRLIEANGDCYDGGWLEGKKHGHGKDIGVLHLTGYWSEGEWKDDRQWNITNYDKDGKVHSKVENGKVKDLENGEQQK